VEEVLRYLVTEPWTACVDDVSEADMITVGKTKDGQSVCCMLYGKNCGAYTCDMRRSFQARHG
jgi:hypothetical protein